jgi:Holliday junction resolvase RusA-like endonuclease
MLETKMSKVILNLPLDVVYYVRKSDNKQMRFILNLNNYRNTHHRILHQAKEKYENIVINNLPEDAKELLYGKKVRVSFKYFQSTNRRVDVSNPIAILEKFATDALVKAGVIEDDNYSVLVGSDGWEYGGVDKNNPRCEMTIYTVE